MVKVRPSIMMSPSRLPVPEPGCMVTVQGDAWGCRCLQLGAALTHGARCIDAESVSKRGGAHTDPTRCVCLCVCVTLRGASAIINSVSLIPDTHTHTACELQQSMLPAMTTSSIETRAPGVSRIPRGHWSCFRKLPGSCEPRWTSTEVIWSPWSPWGRCFWRLQTCTGHMLALLQMLSMP